MNRERVLGIDPGTAIVGWGLVEGAGQNLHLVNYGVIRTPAHTPLSERVLMVYEGIQLLIEQYHPDGVGVEQLFFARNVTTALPVAHARGVILLALQQAGIPLREFTPMEIKQAITGYGRADKHQMQQMVRLLLGLETTPRPDDAADAIAVALCYHQVATFGRLTGS